MSLDERMRAGTRAAAGTQPIDTTAAWEEIQMQAKREHTRRTVVLVAAAAAAVVAGVVWGPGIVDSLSGSGEATPVDQPTDEVRVDDGTDDVQPPNAEAGSVIEPGTYTYTDGPFPVTFTTTGTTYDPSRGGDPYRIVLGDPHGMLQMDFPVTVADLSQTVTPEAAAAGDVQESALGELFAGPIEVPADIGAWLEGAVSLRVVEKGRLGLADGEAPWWDIEVSDPSARCFLDVDEPCVFLWPYPDDRNAPQTRQIGTPVFGSARVYAIESASAPLMVVAVNRDVPDEEVPGWLATTDEIVSSITLE